MIRYAVAATAFKAASLAPFTRQGYRLLGNTVGARRRETRTIQTHYVERLGQMMDLRKGFGVPDDGTRMLEIGTGWLHWEALLASLFFEVEAVLFDVWDNRQLGALKNYVGQLRPHIDDVDIELGRRQRAHRLIESVTSVETIEEVYDTLHFTYVMEPERPIGELGLGTFDLIVSHGVLEHIPPNIVETLTKDIAAMLNPGGVSSQAINIQDHLRQYDSKAHPKQYLSYSDRQWALRFENDVQYINRLQLSEWLAYFDHPGLELVFEDPRPVDLTGLNVSERFSKYSQEDLECGWVHLVHRPSTTLSKPTS